MSVRAIASPLCCACPPGGRCAPSSQVHRVLRDLSYLPDLFGALVFLCMVGIFLPCAFVRVYTDYGSLEDSQRLHSVSDADRWILPVLRFDRQCQYDLSGASG